MATIFCSRTTRAVALVAGLHFASAGLVAAQSPSLAEVAKKEQERRKAAPAAGKVYTNKDLPETQSRPVEAAPASDASAEPTAVAEPVREAAEPPAAEAAVKDEAAWRARMGELREALRRNEVFVEALQSRVNALSRDFVNRDNPVQRRQIGAERTEALNELTRVRAEIDAGRKAIADLEEDARKAGVPPGWLR